MSRVNGDSIGDEYFYIANCHGDVNGDGLEDLLFRGLGSSERGFVEIHSGAVEMDTIPDFQWIGSSGNIICDPLFIVLSSRRTR